MRFWIARIFWYSGVQKFHNWSSTLALFKYEYRVPFITPDIAAFLAASAELTIPPLLVIGLASRLAAIPLLIMTMVIQFTYLDLIDHLYWALLLCTIIFYGPGRYSLDYIIKKNFNDLKWL
ncbi:MAG TPA: DoxX family protein [Candidatus Megaira endosymbiont of Nemacystus decipiens]|nr:DoxX family protein [Candidatus Megaera endosymbiont of Nemacystus decipiens]